MYIYICAYICMYICTSNTYYLKCSYTNTHTYIQHMYVCMYVTHLHLHRDVSAHRHTDTRVHMHIRTTIHTYTPTHTPKDTYTHT